MAFESLARLVPVDTDDRPDIYVLDRTTRLVTLESEGLGEGTEQSHPRISGDGRYVVFESRPRQDALTPRTDIVLRDRIAATSRVLTTTTSNRAPYGWSRNPDISDDGRVVAFSSAATTLADGPDANGAVEDVYLVQVASGAISRASVSSGGAQPDRGDSILPSLSGDGRWLAFASTAPLDDGQPPPGASSEKVARQVYLRDTIGGRTIRITRAASGGLPNGTSWLPTLSADGRRLAFVSDASNLLDDDHNRAADVFLYDRDADALTWVSRAADGSSAGGESTGPIISGNGRFVAFQSDAANLVCARPLRRLRPRATLAAPADRAHTRECRVTSTSSGTPSSSIPERPDRPRERGRARRLDGSERGSGTGRVRPGGRVLFAPCARSDRPWRRLRSVRPRAESSTFRHAQVSLKRTRRRGSGLASCPGRCQLPWP